jgi:hypothetical protein
MPSLQSINDQVTKKTRELSLFRPLQRSQGANDRLIDLENKYAGKKLLVKIEWEFDVEILQQEVPGHKKGW